MSGPLTAILFAISTLGVSIDAKAALCLATVVYHEARSTSEFEQRAVAAVVLNRATVAAGKRDSNKATAIRAGNGSEQIPPTSVPRPDICRVSASREFVFSRRSPVAEPAAWQRAAFVAVGSLAGHWADSTAGAVAFARGRRPPYQGLRPTLHLTHTFWRVK